MGGALAGIDGESGAAGVLARSVAEDDLRGERGALLFVGMDSVGSLDLKEPLACVATFLVRYPMELEGYSEGSGFGIVRVRDERELCRWAESEFDHYEIRAV